MKIIGITGGIGSGKTYVSNKFNELYNIPVYNTDRKTQDNIMHRDHIQTMITMTFGDDSFIDNKLNKDKFRKLLFENKEHLNSMNQIVLPELSIDINNWASEQESNYVLIECAVIFENNIENWFDRIISVMSPLEIKIKRLKENRNLKEDTIESIMKNQISDNKLIENSDYLIWNNNNLINNIKNINKKINELH